MKDATRQAVLSYMLFAFAGGSLGLLIGTLIGLSSSPVVGSVVGGLLPLIVLVASGFSVARAEGRELLPLPGALTFVLAFSLIATAASVAALNYRTSGPEVNLGSVYKDLTSIGLDPKVAQSEALKWFAANPPSGPTQKVLYGASGDGADTSRCEGYTAPSTTPYAAETLTAMAASGKPALVNLARFIKNLPPTLTADQFLVLSRSAYDLGCTS
jgi:hypothetical protein